MSTRAPTLVALLALLALAGCGTVETVREPDVVFHDRGRRPRPAAPAANARAAMPTIAMVTHGQASDHFWVKVRNGAEAAARQLQVRLSYSSPDTYDIRRMRELIDSAVARRPDGLVVSLPDARALAPAVRRAVRSGVPVVTINSGSESSRRLGALAHVGQPERVAGAAAARRLLAAGARRAICVVHEAGNTGLIERCAAFAATMRAHGGSSRNLLVRLQDTTGARRAVVAAARRWRADAIALGTNEASAALAAARAGDLPRETRLVAFGLSDEVLRALQAKRLLFAMEQQPYLQGYLPVLLLAQRARHGLFAGRGQVLLTGPQFVTPQTAASVAAESRRGFR